MFLPAVAMSVNGNPLSKLDAYELRHLVFHLAQRGRQADLLRLLCLERLRPDGGFENAWNTAKESVGDTEGYVQDLALAQQVSEQEMEEDIQASGSAPTLGQQVRYALMGASLKQNVTPVLLARLVEERIWTLEQGLAHARQSPDAHVRAEALARLSRYASTNQRSTIVEEAIGAAHATAFGPYKEKALRGVAGQIDPPQRDELLHEAVSVVMTLERGFERSDALSHMAPDLDQREIERMVDWALSLPVDNSQVELLEVLARYSSEATVGRLVQFARSLDDLERRAILLSAVATSLNEAMRPQLVAEAVPLARMIHDSSARATALIRLATASGAAAGWSLVREAVAIASRIDDPDDDAGTLERLTSVLFRLLVHFNRRMPWVLQNLAPRVAQVLVEPSFVWVTDYAPLLALFPERLKRDFVRQAFALVTQDPEQQLDLLGEITSFLNPKQVDKAVRAIRTKIREPDDRALGLAVLADRLNVPQLHAALEDIRSVGYTDDLEGRSDPLELITPYLPRASLDLARAIAMAIRDEGQAGGALAALAPDIDDDLRYHALDSALAAAARIELESPLYTRRIFKQVGPAIPANLWGRSVDVARNLVGVNTRVSALTALFPHLPDSMRSQVLSIITQALPAIDDAELCAEALAVVAPALVAKNPRVALKAIMRMTHQGARGEAFAAVAPYLPADCRREVDRVAYRQISEINLYRTYAGLAAADPSHELYVRRALSGLRTPGLGRDRFLAKYFKLLEPPKPVVMRYVRSLASIAGVLPEAAVREIMDSFSAITSPEHRIQALLWLRPGLPGLLAREVLANIRSTLDQHLGEEWTATTLVRVSPLIARASKPLVQRAISAARDRGDDLSVVTLLPLTPKSYRVAEAREAAVRAARWDSVFRSEILGAVAPLLLELRTTDLFDLWCSLMKQLQSRARSDFLNDLAGMKPVLVRLGGPPAACEVTRAILDAVRWWP